MSKNLILIVFLIKPYMFSTSQWSVGFVNMVTKRVKLPKNTLHSPSLCLSSSLYGKYSPDIMIIYRIHCLPPPLPMLPIWWLHCIFSRFSSCSSLTLFHLVYALWPRSVTVDLLDFIFHRLSRMPFIHFQCP